MAEEIKKKVIFCTPSLNGPVMPYVKSLEDSLPLIVEAGWEEGYGQEIGNPYISAARAIMTRKALTDGATVLVFLDYDLSWDPQDLLTLIETEGDVVAGTYRYKKEEEEYMGKWIVDDDEQVKTRESDGAIATYLVPAGFLKVTAAGIRQFARMYPELTYGDPLCPHVDLFNHGARDGGWWGEDYAFCDRWKKKGGQIWTVPNLNLNHHGVHPYTRDTTVEFKGNFHNYLLGLPGGKFEQKKEDTTTHITCES